MNSMSIELFSSRMDCWHRVKDALYELFSVVSTRNYFSAILGE